MNRTLVRILLGSCALAAACTTVDPLRVERMSQARRASELQDWPRAASLWYGLYREDPGAEPEVAAGAARALLESGDATSALAVALDSRRLGVGSAELDHVAACALEELGERERAIQELRSALVEQPQRADWWWTLAGWTWAQGQVRPTRRALEQALALGRDGPDVRLLAARVYTRLDDLLPAYDAWCLALAGEADEGADAQAFLEGARVAANPRLANSRPEALAHAVTWYERAAALEPQMVEAQRELARVARLAGNPERAIAALARASELDPTDSTLLADLAELHLASGDRGRALELLRRALDQETDAEWVAEWERRIALVDGLLDDGAPDDRDDPDGAGDAAATPGG